MAVLETGACSTIKEIADLEKIAETYVGRVLRLTLLAPDMSRTEFPSLAAAPWNCAKGPVKCLRRRGYPRSSRATKSLLLFFQ